MNQTKLKIGINKEDHNRDKNIKNAYNKLLVLCSTNK